MISLRTLTLLTLLTGLSLGIFAGTLLAARPGETDDASSRVEEAVQDKLDWYRVRYGLDEDQTEQVRRELITYRRESEASLRKLWREHEAIFEALSQNSKARIKAIIDRTDAPTDGSTNRGD